MDNTALYSRIREDFLKTVMAEKGGTVHDLWFSDIKIEKLEGDKLFILTASDLKRDVIENRYFSYTKEKLSEIIGFDITPVITSAAEEKEAHADESKDSGNSSRREEKFNPKTNEKILYDYDPHISLNEDLSIPLDGNKYTFENFIEGSSNSFARATALCVAEQIGTKYNPLFIHGPSGLGKTHLLWAIIDRVKKNYPQAVIVYVKGDEFTNQLIDCIRHGTTEQFRNKYRTADILLIDDIQFIAGRDSTQEEFFHTFNALRESGRQIIMTSDRPPKDLKTLEERLRTRFESGLTAGIQPPDFELRTAIMKSKAQEMGLSIPDDVITLVANSLKTNIRQLEGAIRKMSAQSFLTGQPISAELAYSCIADLSTAAEPTAVTVDRIITHVSAAMNISIEDIKSKKRSKDIAFARHTCIYLIKALTDMSLSAIGKVFGRDHSTVVNSLDTIENEIQTNPTFSNQIEMLTDELRGM